MRAKAVCLAAPSVQHHESRLPQSSDQQPLARMLQVVMVVVVVVVIVVVVVEVVIVEVVMVFNTQNCASAEAVRRGVETRSLLRQRETHMEPKSKPFATQTPVSLQA
ncbi:unnamed protein product [Polarella glacialis]|uniref:Uncharacterized protein n=1 Tax=Polarella glacialis TaxID=89957 RepID=A0A813FZJ8_POLGL|nr:unnamed protein product [Polarella glacialis]